MLFPKRLQVIILLLSDWLVFYAALIFTLIIRYKLAEGLLEEIPTRTFNQTLAIHQWPFFWIHFLWILVFFINGLYDIKSFPSPKAVLAKVLKTMAAGGILAGLVFYLVPSFEIAPKTNLLVDIIFATSFLMLWRRYFWLFISKVSKIKTLFVGNSPEVKGFADYLEKNTQLGYEPVTIMPAVENNLNEFIAQNGVKIIVASQDVMKDDKAVKRFYEVLPLGVSIVDFPTFYENVAEKIPVSVISESWFLMNLVEINKRLFEYAKRAFDIILSIIFGFLTIFLFPVIGILIKINSRGPIFYHQKRVGQNGKIFDLIKFRSMVHNSELKEGGWVKPKDNDERITFFGNILRKIRLDELPQFWNIFKGEMSFIGPRPERPEFIEELVKQIPHYTMRHLIKPGLTGWSQIHFTDASAKDAMEKLQYDLYYVKNRSFVLDLAIIMRTVATVISRGGR